MKLPILLLCLFAQFLVFACSRASPTPPAVVAPGPGAPVQFVPAGEGDVATLVRAALADAAREQRRLIVYAGSAFCKPCEAFKKAVLAGELDAYLPGLTVLAFESPRDVDRLAAAGYDGAGLPSFTVPLASGRASKHTSVGGALDDTAAMDGAQLRALLARHD